MKQEQIQRKHIDREQEVVQAAEVASSQDAEIAQAKLRHQDIVNDIDYMVSRIDFVLASAEISVA